VHYDLKKPCENCPFRTDSTAIRFSCIERAAEIEESAYRNGFPCHLSAVYRDETFEGSGDEGYVEGEKTQHCAGYMIMQINQGEHAWPGVDNDEDVVEAFAEKMDRNAPIFDSTDDWLQANTRNEYARKRA